MRVEITRGDGTTNHYAREFGYGLVESFKIDWNFNQVSKLSAKIFGRSSQTSTPTGALVGMTGRESLVSNLVSLYADTTWAGLGWTQVVTIIRSASFDCK